LVEYDEILQEARHDDTDEERKNRLTSPSVSKGNDSEEKILYFNKNAMVMLANSLASLDRDSSPYRSSNFDLLVLLLTQESVHRVMRDYMEQSMPALDWLKEFYFGRVRKFFDGHQSQGRADDFLEEILLSPPSFMKDGEQAHLIDPTVVAEDIIRERSNVAQEWKHIISCTWEDHVDLRRCLLAKTLGKSLEDTFQEHTETMEKELSLHLEEIDFELPENVGAFE